MKKRYVIPAIVIVLVVVGIGLSLHHAPVKPVAAQFHFKDQPSKESTPEATDAPLAAPTTQADQTAVDNSVAAPASTDTSTAPAPLTADQQVLQDTGSQIQVTCFDQIMTYRYGDSLTRVRVINQPRYGDVISVYNGIDSRLNHPGMSARRDSDANLIVYRGLVPLSRVISGPHVELLESIEELLVIGIEH
jgi:hypothetical protein